MVRRSAGFVSKRAHRKSRGGCLTCKRKKIKCDENQPACGYCSLRKASCKYPQETSSNSPPSASSLSNRSSPQSTVLSHETDFNGLSIPSWLVSTVQTSSGCLSSFEIELLHHYRTYTWHCLSAREDDTVTTLHRELVPRMSLSNSYLLHTILSIAASHRNSVRPSKYTENQALVYRSRTFAAYNKALQNITTENYESILLTGALLGALIPPPESTDNEECLNWMYTILKTSEGLRILASLRWAAGIEKLSIYPLVLRELRTLPPPPKVHASSPHAQTGPLGTTPDYPNPASTYYFTHPNSVSLFLPPSLMNLLSAHSENHKVLMPVFHALSPIFLSLYYYHLNPDFYVRIHVFCSFLMPDFILLVRDKEPGALVLIAWWLALMDLVPSGWGGRRVRRIVEAVGRCVKGRGGILLDKATEEAERIVEVCEREGRDRAARRLFEQWEGVDWDEGQTRAEQWEASLFEDLNFEGDLEVLI